MDLPGELHIANLDAVAGASHWATFVSESVAFLRTSHSYRVLDEDAFRDRLETICAAVPSFAEFVLDRIEAADG